MYSSTLLQFLFSILVYVSTKLQDILANACALENFIRYEYVHRVFVLSRQRSRKTFQELKAKGPPLH